MRVLNGISEGLMVSGLLGLGAQCFWRASSLSLWLFGGYCLLWIVATVYDHEALARIFNRTPALPAKFPPRLVSQILEQNPESWSEPRASMAEACQILQQRMGFSIRALAFMGIGWVIVAKGMDGSFDVWLSWVPMVQGIMGAALGIGYGFWIHHRVSKVYRMLA